LLQFTLASTVYFTFSKLFPARETMLDRAILDKEETRSEDASNGGDDDHDDKKDRGLVDVLKVA
jgi:hypothetical protein